VIRGAPCAPALPAFQPPCPVPAPTPAARPTAHGDGAPSAVLEPLRVEALDAAMDVLHARLDAWEQTGAFDGCLGEFGRHVLRLALHEWVANLVQHAAFGRRQPYVAVGVACADGGVRCVVEDNSDGFDFQRQLVHQEGALDAAEPSERGRGLLMLIACTEQIAYVSRRGRQRLSFLVRNSDEDGADEDFPTLFPLPE